jgi:Leucine Rich repeat
MARAMLTMEAAVGWLMAILMMALVCADSGDRHHPHQRQQYGSSDSDSSSPSFSSSIDWSGLHSLRGSPVLEEALRGFFLGHQARVRAASKRRQTRRDGDRGRPNDGQDENLSVAAIDVSQSALRDEDFDNILKALFPMDDANITSGSNDSGVDGPTSSHDGAHGDAKRKDEGLQLQFTAYGNQLTGGAVQKLVGRIRRYQIQLNASRQDSSNETVSSDNSTAQSIDDGNSTSNEETDLSQSETPATTTAVPPRAHSSAVEQRVLECLDLSWNPLFLSDSPANRKKRKAKSEAADDLRPRSTKEALQVLVAMPGLRSLRLDCCGLDAAHCRSLAKGLLDRYPAEKAPVSTVSSDIPSSQSHDGRESEPPRPFSLHLSGNGAMGDAGAAALAAALRTLVRRHKPQSSSSSATSPAVVLETLDLSSCGIGDVGAEALAVALESHRSARNDPVLLIRRLNLSHNRISSIGATALGRALQIPTTQGSSGSATPTADAFSDVVLLGLDLSDNKDVGDKGAAGIAGAVASGRLPCVSMRSCNVYADGAASFGKALRRAAVASTYDVVEIDLSGNPLGVLRGKKKEDGKYSASRLKSKASATAASYVSQGMSFLRKNLKDVGVDVAPLLGGTSAESDDEEEKNSEDSVDDDYDPSKGRCGAKAMANAFIEASEEDYGPLQGTPTLTRVRLELRHCYFDHSAADALAAMLVTARSKLNVDFDFDVSLNAILEEEMVSALEGDNANEHLLVEMAERHQDALDALKEARARATHASAAAAARVRADGDSYKAEWDAAGIRPNYDDEDDDVRDSDADYEDE